MGQENAVKVVRFCVRDTIEERLFEEIDLAAAKLVTRSNDNTYMCESAHKSLDKKVLQKKKPEVDEEVFVGESVSANERVARTMAEARAKNEIIVIDDSDEEETPKSALEDVRMKVAATSTTPVKVKPELSAGGVASVKRSNSEVGETETAASPGKRARVSTETVPSATPSPNTQKKWQCDFDGCEAKFRTYISALAHEQNCHKSNVEGSKISDDSVTQDVTPTSSTLANNTHAHAEGTIHDTVMRDAAPTVSNEEETNSSMSVVSFDAERQKARTTSKSIYLVEPGGKIHDSETVCQKWAKEQEEYAKAVGKEKLNGNDMHWLEMLRGLKRVKEETGVAWVAGQRCKLGQWCGYQRRGYKKHLKGERSVLNEARIKLLNDIRFPWNKTEATPRKQSTRAQVEARIVSPITSDVAAEGNVSPSPSPNKGSDTEVLPTSDAVAETIASPSLPSNNESGIAEQIEANLGEIQATLPQASQPAANDDDAGRVVSPPAAEQDMEVSTETTSPLPNEGSDTGVSFISDAAVETIASSSPPLNNESGIAKQTQDNLGEIQVTPPKASQPAANDDSAGRVVSPPAAEQDMAVSTEATDDDGLKSLLVKCELGQQYLKKFQDAGISSATQLQDKLQDLSFMQELVNSAGLTASEAIGLQILASKQ